MLDRLPWRDKFPGLAELSETVSDLLDKQARSVEIKQGSLIFGPGNPAENLLLLVSGTVRVQQLSEAGREIVLYRVHAGESCVLTTACLLAFLLTFTGHNYLLVSAGLSRLSRPDPFGPSS